MPNIKSARKRVKVSMTKTLQNKRIKSGVKTIVKRFESTLKSKDADASNALYSEVTKKIDMAAAKGTLHKNAANRKKAKLALRMKAASDK